MTLSNTARTAIKLIITVSILAVIALRLDWSAFLQIVKNIDFSFWIGAITLICLQILFISLRWGILINIPDSKIPRLETIRITVISMIANLLFITSIGGVVVRTALAMQFGVSLVKALFATIIDRMMTLAALLILTAIFMHNLKGVIADELYNSLLLLLGAVCLTGLLAVPLLFSGTYTLKVFQSKRFENIILYIKSLLTNQIRLFKVIALSVLAQSCFLFAVFLIVQSAGYTGPALPILAILPVLSIIASLPVGFGGWGIREGAFVLGLGLLDFTLETAFLISVQIGIVSIIATLIMGLPAILSYKFSNTAFSFKDTFFKNSLIK